MMYSGPRQYSKISVFGGSCESDGFSQLLIPLLFRFASTIDTMHSMTKILQGKTVYLAKIIDKLVTKGAFL